MSEIEAVRQSVERIVRETLTPSDIAASEDARVLPARLRGALLDAGVLAMLASEEHGGSGATLSQTLECQRILGAAAAPGPWLEMMLGQMLLARAGLGTANGNLSICFVPGVLGPPIGATHWEAPPTLQAVPWGGAVDKILVVLSSAESTRLVL